MKNKYHNGQSRGWIIVILAGLLVIPLALINPVRAEIDLEAEPNETCLDCHGAPGLIKELADASEVELYVDTELFSKSIHGDKLVCTDCHSASSEIPHPERQYPSRRAYTIARYEGCKRCHFRNYTRTLESVHYEMLSRGDLRAPVCVDCHGAHEISRPGERRNVISRSCAKCHKEIYGTYTGSVHGKALMEENNLDVPTCIDCHKAHNIEDARTVAFQLRTPDLCGGCHADQELMRKYGISSNVLETYLQDFHGMTITLLKKSGRNDVAFTATCTDCHGIHDITETDYPDSRVMKANLIETCRQCHTDANERFPDAWLSHYDPSPKKATLVYLVKLFYSFFIPFVIGGLILHITLHVHRVASNR